MERSPSDRIENGDEWTVDHHIFVRNVWTKVPRCYVGCRVSAVRKIVNGRVRVRPQKCKGIDS